MLFAYLNLRKAEREGWSIGAKNKAGTKDLQALSKTLMFLEEHNIQSVNDLAVLLNKTGKRLYDAKAANRPKEQRIRDIDAIIKADKTINEFGPILEKYNGIHFKSSKERYAKEHAEEIDRVKKAQWLLHKLNTSMPINKKLLLAEAAEFRTEIASSAADLESIQTELEQLLTRSAEEAIRQHEERKRLEYIIEEESKKRSYQRQ